MRQTRVAQTFATVRPWHFVWKNMEMKRAFAATVWREGDWYVSQCLEIDVASQGATEEDALAKLKEALELQHMLFAC